MSRNERQKFLKRIETITKEVKQLPPSQRVNIGHEYIPSDPETQADHPKGTNNDK